MLPWLGSQPSSRDQKGFERRVHFMKRKERFKTFFGSVF